MALNKFWDSLEALCIYQRERYEAVWQRDTLLQIQNRNQERDSEEASFSSIENIIEGVVKSLASGNSPVLRVPKHDRNPDSNSRVTGEDLVSAGNPKSTRRFSFLLDLLSKSYLLLKTDKHITLRDAFYENVSLYDNQRALNEAAEDAARMIGVPRVALHLTITGKGLIAGSLVFTTIDNSVVNVSEARQGVLVPHLVSGIHSVVSEARFILVVEKDATFQHLLQAQFLTQFGPSILITGKGYPDLCTRQMLNRLWAELKIPVLALVDADPYGIHIAAVYKYGALARDDPSLKVDGLALMGILPSDLRGLRFPSKALLPLTPRDHGKLGYLEAHPALKENPAWLEQIRCMREMGVKAEIQSLTHISQDFLTSVYLPSKITFGGWIL